MRQKGSIEVTDCVSSSDSGTPCVQHGRGGAIPTETLFKKSDWWVSTVSLNKTQRMVRQWHYSKGGSNTAVYCHGLFPRGEFWDEKCVGVAWWLPPTKTAAQSFDKNWIGVLALSRLVVSPDVPNNAESFLIRHAMKLIDRNRWPVLVTYADSWRGHKGTIYRAAGWKECGQSKPERRYVLNGRMISRKAGPKTRTHSEMLALGAECVGSFSAIRFVHRIEAGGTR